LSEHFNGVQSLSEMKARNNASDEGEKKEGKKEGITEERKE
jgi:hypothetical protein